MLRRLGEAAERGESHTLWGTRVLGWEGEGIYHVFGKNWWHASQEETKVGEKDG